MIVTEKEAGTKWCPLVRVPIDMAPDAEALHLSTANRVTSGEPAATAYCLGSRCMFWVQVDGEKSKLRHNTDRAATGRCGAANHERARL